MSFGADGSPGGEGKGMPTSAAGNKKWPHAPSLRVVAAPKGAAFLPGAARRQNRAPRSPHCVWSLPPMGRPGGARGRVCVTSL